MLLDPMFSSKNPPYISPVMGQTVIPFPLCWSAHELATEAEVGRGQDEILFPNVSPGGLRPLYSALR